MIPVLAVDPGQVTGLALWRWDVPRPVTFELSPVETVRSIDKLVLDAQHLVIVYEAFVISERTIRSSPQHDALDQIGWLRLQAAGFPSWANVLLHRQTAAQAKKFSTDEKLKRAGWWERTPGGHANDAQRHLLVYLTRFHAKEPVVLDLLRRCTG